MSAISFQVAEELKQERAQDEMWGGFGSIMPLLGGFGGERQSGGGGLDDWWSGGSQALGTASGVLDLFGGMFGGDEGMAEICPRVGVPETEPFTQLCPTRLPDAQEGRDYVIGATGARVYLDDDPAFDKMIEDARNGG